MLQRDFTIHSHIQMAWKALLSLSYSPLWFKF